eukprot:gb/GFBE01021688.1/.p1 GENE.gb/GFBE01021688.1/~~gb/GFBE01021688.1/.p1  ORF type:complete len:141 (+),score=12.36 gb/GFBE01021688.1/:1-423(+)
MVTNMFQFGWWRCKERPGTLTHWQRWDAAYFLGASVPLNCGMPLAVVLIYIGELGYPESKMWHSGSWFPNTVHGGLLYFCKWLGVACLTVGVFKATQLHRKIAKKWRKLRGHPAVVHKADSDAEAQVSAGDTKVHTVNVQ